MYKNNVSFEELNKLILLFIDINNPNVEDSLFFVGQLIKEIINRINIPNDEKFYYNDIYRQVINKKLSEKILSG